KWLSFIHRRMVLVKKLLSPAGVLFVHIDDNEFAQLKLLLDGVMGPDMFLADLIWHRKNTRQNDARYFSGNTEHILCYASSDATVIRRPARTEANNKAFTDDGDPRGAWQTVPIHAKSGSAKNLYTITFPNGIEWTPPPGRFPAYTKEGLMALYEAGEIRFGQDGKGGPRRKVYLEDMPTSVVPNTLLPVDLVGSTQEGKAAFKDVLGGIEDFPSPKPLRLIKFLIEMGCPPGGTALDCFAGSGTSGVAVLEMNAEDEASKRSFILATNNENGICREVTRERLRKVMEGYVTPKGKAVAGTGGKLRYLTAWPLPSFEASEGDPECLIRDVSLSEALRRQETLPDLVALRHGCGYEAAKDGKPVLMAGHRASAAVAASGSMTDVDAALGTLLPLDGEKHLYVPCRGGSAPQAVAELCSREGVTAHAFPADLLEQLRYEKAGD
ncbi:MAG: site-specific DNA-methyltransferase, partial [Desulfobacterales bacterium]|nr:site-specific DNA-methyltransferase [Desulfobacterales bacterium]